MKIPAIYSPEVLPPSTAKLRRAIMQQIRLEMDVMSTQQKLLQEHEDAWKAREDKR